MNILFPRARICRIARLFFFFLRAQYRRRERKPARWKMRKEKRDDHGRISIERRVCSLLLPQGGIYTLIARDRVVRNGYSRNGYFHSEVNFVITQDCKHTYISCAMCGVFLLAAGKREAQNTHTWISVSLIG